MNASDFSRSPAGAHGPDQAAPIRVLGSPRAAGGSTGPLRVAGRGRVRPSGRAALGSLLIVASGMGLFVAANRASERPTQPYLTASRELPRGHILTASDLTPANLDLALPVAERSFLDPTVLIGAVVVAPLAQGELIQGSAVQRGGSGLREMSFPIESSRAVAGTLSAGDRIDVVATFNEATGSTTRTVLTNIEITTIEKDLLETSPDAPTVLRVSVTAEQQVVLANAIDTATIFVVRANDRLSDTAPMANESGSATEAGRGAESVVPASSIAPPASVSATSATPAPATPATPGTPVKPTPAKPNPAKPAAAPTTAASAT
jgi:Flp pilus assembly protein CpaB